MDIYKLIRHNNLLELHNLLDEQPELVHYKVDDTIPLLYAVSNNRNTDIIKLLVDYGSDINFVTEGGLSILMFACNTGNYEIAKYLVDNGAYVNGHFISLDNDWVGPITFANSNLFSRYLDRKIKIKYAKIICLLIQCGSYTSDKWHTVYKIYKEFGITDEFVEYYRIINSNRQHVATSFLV